MNNLQDNSKRAKVATIVFGLICIINIVAVISGYWEYELLEKIRIGENISEEEAIFNDLRQGIVGIFQFVVYLTSIVVFLMWFRRAYENLHKLGIDYLEYNTNMAVWSFFIPFINLYRPYKIMKEIWIESQEQLKKLVPEANINTSIFIVGFWWALFLITNYIGNFAFKTIFKDDTIQDLIKSTQAYMVSDFFDIPAAFVTLILIHNVSKVEAKLRQSIENMGGSTG
jgi:hypothetical protein